jgi:acylphosphatase
MRRLTALVSGRVQHVGYRSRVATMAKTLDLKGFVKNLPDGSVLIVAEGDLVDLERFLRAIKFEDALIRVEEVRAGFSEARGAWDEFYKIAGERETDSRLDTATVFLKELITVVKDGFKETNTRLGSMDAKLGSIDSKLDTVACKLDRIVKAQVELVDKLDLARRDIVSEMKGLRSDLKDRFDGRLQKVEISVDEVKTRMRLRPT